MIQNRIGRAIFGALLLLSYVGSFKRGCINHQLGSNGSGWFFSPNFPYDYYDNANCKLLIDTSVPIIISFIHFSLETCCDWLKIYDGPTETSDLLIRTSTFPDSSILTTANKVLVTFTTDGSRTFSGFKATYSPYRCQYNLSSSSGWFSSPGHPLNYPNRLNCSWLIKIDNPISLSFSRFHMETGNDWLTIYDGPTQSSAIILKTSSNSTLPPSIVVFANQIHSSAMAVGTQAGLITASAKQILVTFTSNENVVYSGFNATYSPFRCHYVLTSDSGRITSPNHPLNYPHRANCSWLINVKQPIIFSFNRFHLEQDNDWLTIYDGPTTSSIQLLKASSNATVPSSIISNSNQVLVTFFSDGSDSYPGFNTTYSLYNNLSTGCHFVPSSDSGWLTSPNHPLNYPNNVNCSWLISAKDPIIFSFTHFAMATPCCDWLTIYDGPTKSSVLLLKASSNNTIPSSIVSTARQVLVTFTSDGSSFSSGFNATYSPFRCYHVLSSDSGWFTSPHYPDNYLNNANCTWLINATQPVILTFSHFHLETNRDWLNIYDGPTQSRSLVLKASVNYTVPSSIVSTSSQVLVTFIADGSNSYSGFNISYSLYNKLSSGCHFVLTSDSGWLTSPNHPRDYPHNVNCSWLINATQPTVLFISRLHFETCCDWLTVYNGPSTSSPLLMKTSRNYTIPSLIVVTSQVLVTFTSNGSGSFSGFKATYEPYSPGITHIPVSCNGTTYVDSSGSTLTSLNYPFNYPDIRCNWHFVSDPGTTIQISFTDFSTRPEDFVSIYDGIRSDFTNRLMIASGINASDPLSCNYLSKSNEIHVAFNPLFDPFTSQSIPGRAGFRAIITTDIHGYVGKYRTDSAESCLQSLEIPGSQEIGQQLFRTGRCVWHIQVDENLQINLTLSNTIELKSSADSYSLEVFEGHLLNNEETLLANGTNFSSFQKPFFVVSKTNEITVVLNDNTKYSSGCRPRGYPKLNLTYEAIATSTYGCYGRMNLNTRKLLPSPGYPNQLAPLSLRCKWRIRQLSGSEISIISYNNSVHYVGTYHDTWLAFLYGN